MDSADQIEDLTLEEMKELQKKLNELVVDREIAIAVAKADHDDGKEEKQADSKARAILPRVRD